MPRVQVLTEVQGRAQEVMLTEHVPSECSPTSITLTSSSSAWAWALVDAEHHEQEQAIRA